jgi:signal transduction histidine kinase
MPAPSPRDQPRDLRIWIRVLTPLLVTALGAGALLQYRRSVREAEEGFSARQRFVALQAADRLAAVFVEARKLLALLQHLRHTPPDGGALAALARVVGELGEPGAAYAWWVDHEGTALLSTQKPGGELEQLWRRLPRCPRILTPAGGGIMLPQLCVSGPHPTRLTRSGWLLVVAIGMPPQPAGARGAGGGDLALVLDWGELRDMISRLIRFSPETQAWMLDGRGRLILHPNHRDAQSAQALARGLGCPSCHRVLGELNERMREGRAGSTRLALGTRDRLVAYAPLSVGPETWALAIATPAGLATEAEHHGLAAILLFPAGIILVMVAGAVLLDRDASRRIREAAAWSADLERKVAERTGELTALHARLSEVQAQHTRLERVAVAGELASIVAHEVRTPLNALSINTQLIGRKLRRGGEGDRESVLELLGTVEREVARISDLLEEHLLALVRHRRVELRAVALNEVVSEALHFIEPEASGRRVRLELALAESPTVKADPGKLRQVLLNILLNAVQAVPAGGRISVATEVGDGVASVRIGDEGPGIAWLEGDGEQDVAQVFKPFVTTKPDGTGLGLAICVRLVKELRGRLRVARGAAGGACFRVELGTRSDDEREE